MSNSLHVDCIGAFSVRSFVRLSVSQSVGPTIGPFFGPSIGWMHRCLPVRLVINNILRVHLSCQRLLENIADFQMPDNPFEASNVTFVS